MDVSLHRLCVSIIFRKGDSFVLRWERVQRVWRSSVSSELLMWGGSVRSIMLLPLVTSCLEIIDVCIWRMFAFMYSYNRYQTIVCGNVVV